MTVITNTVLFSTFKSFRQPDYNHYLLHNHVHQIHSTPLSRTPDQSKVTFQKLKIENNMNTNLFPAMTEHVNENITT